MCKQKAANFTTKMEIGSLWLVSSSRCTDLDRLGTNTHLMRSNSNTNACFRSEFRKTNTCTNNNTFPLVLKYRFFFIFDDIQNTNTILSLRILKYNCRYICFSSDISKCKLIIKRHNALISENEHPSQYLFLCFPRCSF